jgi:hypothetical protein
MLSINVTVYDSGNNKEIIKLRLCPACHKRQVEDLQSRSWNNDLRTEMEIKTDPDLAQESNLDFDDSEAAMRQAGLIREFTR